MGSSLTFAGTASNDIQLLHIIPYTVRSSVYSDACGKDALFLEELTGYEGR